MSTVLQILHFSFSNWVHKNNIFCSLFPSDEKKPIHDCRNNSRCCRLLGLLNKKLNLQKKRGKV